MVRNCKLIGIALVLGILCVPSCIKEMGNVETEYFFGDHEGESLVLGRIGVVEGGIGKSWESPRKGPSVKTSFQIFIRGTHSELRVSHYLRGDGYFCLLLPPGKYRLWRWIYRFPGGHADTVEPFSIIFEVLPGKRTYVGTLYINLPSISSMARPSLGGKRVKPRYEIVDEYGTAVGFWRKHYPDFPPSVERHLMHFSR
jgi:hypothetical protein